MNVSVSMKLIEGARQSPAKEENGVGGERFMTKPTKHTEMIDGWTGPKKLLCVFVATLDTTFRLGRCLGFS